MKIGHIFKKSFLHFLILKLKINSNKIKSKTIAHCGNSFSLIVKS